MTEDFDPELTRRDRMMLFRDLLLVLEMNGKPMKPTIVMYSMNMGWTPMVKLVKFLNRKQLVEISKPERLNTRGRPRTDKRSNARVSITLKGKYMLRLLDEMIRYLYDEAPPIINPPMWLMRKALETKGFSFMGELAKLEKQHLLIAPDDDPTPFGSFSVEKPEDSVIPIAPASLSADEKQGVSFTLTAVNQLPPIRDHRPYNKAKEVAAGFFVVNRNVENLTAEFEVKPRLIGIHCPECGRPFWSLKAVAIHTGHKHPEKKEGIMAQIRKFHANVA